MDKGMFEPRIWLGLTAFALVTIALAVTFRDVPFVEQFAPGLATEVLGILLTLAFVQRFLQRQEKERRLRSSIGAIRKAGRALGHLVGMWASVVKGSLPAEPDPLPDSMEILFSPKYTEHLARSDLAILRKDPVQLTTGPWMDWVVERLDHVRRSLSEVIGTYGASLEPRYIEALDDLLDDPFLDAVKEISLRRLYGAGTDQPLGLPPSPAFRRGHFERLLEVIELHNEVASEAARIRSNQSGVKTPLLGIERAPDQDLKVGFAPHARWWLTTPRPGELLEQGGT